MTIAEHAEQKALLTDSVLLFCNSVPKHKHFKRTNAYQTRTNDHFLGQTTSVIDPSYRASYQKRTSAYQKAQKSSFGTISFPHFHRLYNFFIQNPVENYQKIVPWYSWQKVKTYQKRTKNVPGIVPRVI